MSVSCQNESPLLRAYLLGSLEFDAALNLQRSLAFGLGGGDPGGALVLCEHGPLITVGRQGRPADILLTPDELAANRWSVRWAPRGGGCVLHLPGQLAVYPVLPLARMGITVPDYLNRLQGVLVRVLDDFGVRARTDPERAGVWVGDRPIAAVGVAVREGVSLFGAVLNIDPDLHLARLVRWGEGPVTSLARERKGPLRHAHVRQRLLEHFAAAFDFPRTELLFHPPALPGANRRPAPSRHGQAD